MDLSTTYLGLALKNPIVASSSPLTREVAGICRLAEAGAAAIVLPSLFEEQIESEMNRLEISMGAGGHAEAATYFPDIELNPAQTGEYLKTIERAKKETAIPIIASLNGTSEGGWMRYANLIEDAGADAIELNIYYMTTDPNRTGEQVEATYLEAVTSVVNRVHIPVSVKVGPFFSSLPHIANRFAERGAKGLVLFNRFYQPDIDIQSLEVNPSLSYSRSEEMRLPLRWTAILYGKAHLDLALTTGVHTSTDVLKAIMAGASVTMMASELLQNGVSRVGIILEQMERWMTENEYTSIQQMRGSMSQANVANPDAFERANYMRILDSYRYNPLSLPQ